MCVVCDVCPPAFPWPAQASAAGGNLQAEWGARACTRLRAALLWRNETLSLHGAAVALPSQQNPSSPAPAHCLRKAFSNPSETARNFELCAVST